MSAEPSPAPGSLSAELARFCQYLAARNYSPFTIEQRERAISAFISWAAVRGVERPQDVTLPILERYQRHLFHHRKADGEPLTFRTQIVRLVPLRAFFKWLARERVILFNPAADLELPRGEKRLPATILAPEEVEAVMALPDIATPQGLRDRAILEVLYATGARRLEITRMRVFDVDYARKLIVIRKGKGGKDRIVPTGERALSWLAAYRDQARPQLVSGADDGALFLTAKGAALNPKKLSDRVSAYVTAAGLNKSGSCHLFRHTAATLMLENGADIRFIQAMLGHESLDTTQIYTQVGIAKLAAVQAATHPGAALKREHLAAALAGECGEEDAGLD
ncbi:site-specific tyrosine recombinase XerC [Vitreimonas sp.]|uniref:site-specific tyrosine recombinase XerC n=1 Tax=Vitreimonas sp. TaxID=3069702 RepID=UPI002D789111|nr:site-specific tyrosine recombinase XerC [Vitreimonas sp.]